MPAVVQGVKGLQRPLKGFGLRDLGKDETNLALADSSGMSRCRQKSTELLPMMLFGRRLAQKLDGLLYPLVILVVRRLGHLGLLQLPTLLDGALLLLYFLLGLLAFGER